MKTYQDLTMDQKLIHAKLIDLITHSDHDTKDYCIAMGNVLNMLKRGIKKCH